jgi:hypothetical protein
LSIWRAQPRSLCNLLLECSQRSNVDEDAGRCCTYIHVYTSMSHAGGGNITYITCVDVTRPRLPFSAPIYFPVLMSSTINSMIVGKTDIWYGLQGSHFCSHPRHSLSMMLESPFSLAAAVALLFSSRTVASVRESVVVTAAAIAKGGGY